MREKEIDTDNELAEGKYRVDGEAPRGQDSQAVFCPMRSGGVWYIPMALGLTAAE